MVGKLIAVNLKKKWFLFKNVLFVVLFAFIVKVINSYVSFFALTNNLVLESIPPDFMEEHIHPVLPLHQKMVVVKICVWPSLVSSAPDLNLHNFHVAYGTCKPDSPSSVTAGQEMTDPDYTV